jgi:hypothetical protein
MSRARDVANRIISAVDAAGDLIVGAADDSVGRVPLGSDGQVLTVDTAGSGVNKVQWATPATSIAIAHYTETYGAVATQTVESGNYFVTTDNDTQLTVGSDTRVGTGILSVGSTASTFTITRPNAVPSTWTTRTSQTTSSMNAATWGAGLFVLGGGNGQMTTSTDGVTWTTRTSGFGTQGIFALTYGNGVYVAGGLVGTLTTSTDGTTWTTRTSNFGSTAIRALTYGDGLYVAGGETGQLRTSTDAVTWTTRTSTFGATNIRALTYGTLYVAGGDQGQLRTSTDAITWTTRTSGFGVSTINALAYSDGIYIATGAGGTINTSTDGVTWTARTSGSTSPINGVAVSKGVFVLAVNSAVSTANLIVSRDGGVTWAFSDSQVAFGLSAVAASGERWVVTSTGTTGNLVTTAPEDGTPTGVVATKLTTV